MNSGACSCGNSSCGEEDDDDGAGSCWSCSTAEADEVAARTAGFNLLDARSLSDLLDPERLVAALDQCLNEGYVRGSVVETWDATLSDHLEAIADLVLYQTPEEYAVSRAVHEQLMELSAALRPPPLSGGDHDGRQQPARADANRVYGTLRSAARSLLACAPAAVDACCRQNMCRAVGLAAAALRCNTRPVFTVENFLVEINEAANFANMYCTEYAKRICAALTGIYDAVMAGEYHPTGVTVQMAVMEKSIRAALNTLADGRATAAQKTAAQQSLLAELDGICATVRMKNYGCVYDGAAVQPPPPQPPQPPPATDDRDATAVAALQARRSRYPVHFTMSPWRAPIRAYHQQSSVSVDQILKSTVRLVEALVSELFKPCLSDRQRRHRRRRTVREKLL